jgi:hypothetical protein
MAKSCIDLNPLTYIEFALVPNRPYRIYPKTFVPCAYGTLLYCLQYGYTRTQDKLYNTFNIQRYLQYMKQKKLFLRKNYGPSCLFRNTASPPTTLPLPHPLPHPLPPRQQGILNCEWCQ